MTCKPEPTVAASPADGVVLSYAIRSTVKARELLIRNAVMFTHAPLLVHVCRGLDQNFSVAMRRWLKTHAARVHTNPAQLRVVKNTPSVLAAHLSNFEFCERPGMPCAASVHGGLRFVLMATNQALFRPGLEQWVQEHSLSFCITNMCTDIGDSSLFAVNGHGLERWRQQVDRLSWRGEPQQSALYRSVQTAARASADTIIVNDSWAHLFAALLRHGGAGGAWAARPVNFMPHEGSYYPVHVLRHFLRCGLQGSIFSLAAAQCEPCRCCTLYARVRVTDASKVACDCAALRRLDLRGSCALEELLLPTFVWQHYAHLLPTASPPVVLRAWASLGRLAHKATSPPQNHSNTTPGEPRTGNELDHLASYLIDDPSRFGHLFGLKVPRHDFDHLVALFRRTLAHA